MRSPCIKDILAESSSRYCYSCKVDAFAEYIQVALAVKPVMALVKAAIITHHPPEQQPVQQGH
jgi:hypothetical protein